MSNGLENPPTRAPVQGLLVLNAQHRYEETGREQQESSAKLRRSHADNRVRLLVHFRPASHHARVILKMAVPVGVTEHDIGSAARSMLVGGMEEAAEIRLKLQYVEVVSAHLIQPRACRIVTRAQPHAGHLIGG